MSYYDFGLQWIDQKALFETIESVFAKALGLDKASNDYPPDPFTVVAHNMIIQTSYTDALQFENVRKANKTLSNAVGNMHQKILGLSENWTDMGTNGGLVDLRTKPGYKHPRFGRPVVVEVKNRFNTIKASDEPRVWDAIDNACKVVGDNAQGYLFQITPKTPHRYDHEWTPSNRAAKKNVRVCDGATAYEIVFGERHALKELFIAMPKILQAVQRENGLQVWESVPTDMELEFLYKMVFPD